VVADGGIIVGRSNLPVINEGDALFHIAELPNRQAAADVVDTLANQMEAQAMFDEDEII